MNTCRVLRLLGRFETVIGPGGVHPKDFRPAQLGFLFDQQKAKLGHPRPSLVTSCLGVEAQRLMRRTRCNSTVGQAHPVCETERCGKRAIDGRLREDDSFTLS